MKHYRLFKELQRNASLLAYYTLFALVPLLTYVLAFGHLFIKETEVSHFVLETLDVQKTIFSLLFRIAETAFTLAQGHFIALFSLLLYILSMVSIISNLERILDSILGYKVLRSFKQKILLYPFIIVLLPPLMIFAMGLDFYLAAVFDKLAHETIWVEVLKPIILRIIPYLLIAFFFFISYSLLPSERPRLLPTLLISFISAFFFQLFQWIFTFFQIWAVRFNPIYGAFVIFPLFLIWLEISWLNLLAGAKCIPFFQRKMNL